MSARTASTQHGSSVARNVDLEIGTKATVRALAEELSDRLLAMYTGRLRGLNRAHYEVETLTKTADATIRGFVRILKRLSPAGKRAWKKATVRDFNIGIQCEREPRYFEVAIDAATLSEVAKLGGRIVVTVYAPYRPPSRTPSRSRR